MLTIALVPLRGGSKSIPLKNIKPIAGKPLCLWTLEAAVDAEIFDSVVVSTEDDRIADVVRSHMPMVRIIRRPIELATDYASTESVMIHTASEIQFDVLCTIQATSPLTTALDLREAYMQFEKNGADSMLTAVRLKRFLWNDDGSPCNYDPGNRPMRQNFRGTLMENGAFYFTKRLLLERTGCRIGGKICIYEMPEESSTELDEPADWRIVENILRRSEKNRTIQIVNKLKYFFFDVDGTLTNAAMYYSENGEELKCFSTRDGMGIRRLQESGIEVGIITSEVSPIVRARAEKLLIKTVLDGVADKGKEIEKFCKKKLICSSEIGFMGDDLNDISAVEYCGFSACPYDAHEEVSTRVDYICSKMGGHGAVRELCEWLLASRNKNR